MLERISSPEHISKDRVIDTFKEKGIEDPEAKALCDTWYIQEQEKMEQADTPEALIAFNLGLADIYEGIEDYREAYNILESMLDAVTSQGDVDLYNSIMTRMESLSERIIE